MNHVAFFIFLTRRFVGLLLVIDCLVEATDALVIRLLDASLCLLSCWQKRGFRPVLPTIGFEPMTLAV